MDQRVKEAFEALRAHGAAVKKLHLRTLFEQDPGRFPRFTAEACGILMDYSKSRITADTLPLLEKLAKAAGVEARRDAMFAGDKINTTEDRAVLHTALRNRSNYAGHGGRQGRDAGSERRPGRHAEIHRRGARRYPYRLHRQTHHRRRQYRHRRLRPWAAHGGPRAVAGRTAGPAGPFRLPMSTRPTCTTCWRPWIRPRPCS